MEHTTECGRYELHNMCYMDRVTREICGNDLFWKQKSEKDIPLEAGNKPQE